MAGKILGDLGARVLKIEDSTHKDPFLSGMFSEFDQSFEHWYEELNQNKQIIRLDFKAPETKEIIQNYLKEASGVILSLSENLKTKLGLSTIDLQKYPLAAIDLAASSTHNKSMHDLNALAITGLLSLHVAHEEGDTLRPPFLPAAGIAFGQQIATEMLAMILKVKETGQLVHSICYLHDSVEKIFSPLWPKKQRDLHQTLFLHNGAYPCYSLYRLKDHNYLAVAAVEEKFWVDLTETFSIPWSKEKRFDRGEEGFAALSSVFAKLSSSEIETMSKNKELCISIVRKEN
jgi:crotonobetainyl-CoA:carnitine CoA-transferase CaiB-like acyl-CoA transferase